MSRKEQKNCFSRFFKSAANEGNRNNYEEPQSSSNNRRPNLDRLRAYSSVPASTAVGREETQNVSSTQGSSRSVPEASNIQFLKQYEYVRPPRYQPAHENRAVIHSIEVLPPTATTSSANNAINVTSYERNIQTQTPMMFHFDDDDQFENDPLLTNVLSGTSGMVAPNPPATQPQQFTFEEDDIFEDDEIMRQILSNK